MAAPPDGRVQGAWAGTTHARGLTPTLSWCGGSTDTGVSSCFRTGERKSEALWNASQKYCGTQVGNTADREGREQRKRRLGGGGRTAHGRQDADIGRAKCGTQRTHTCEVWNAARTHMRGRISVM
eukprot:129893-Chlamydomonas_euryale.AAC.3